MQTLKDKGIITNSISIICKSCLERCKDSTKFQENVETENNSESGSEDIDHSCNIEMPLESVTEITSNAKTLFLNQSENLKLDNLIDFDARKRLQQQAVTLVIPVAHLRNIDVNTAADKKLMKIIKTLELIYSCQNSKLILPMYFQDNLLLYSLTNSKTMVNYCNTFLPSGGYNFLSNWLSKLADKPISFPSGLARAVFDYNQKVGRTYVITGDNKFPGSTMTSHLWLIFDETSKHQESEILKPKNWMWDKTDESFSTLLERICEVDKVFRESRDTFLKQCIELLSFSIKTTKMTL